MTLEGKKEEKDEFAHRAEGGKRGSTQARGPERGMALPFPEGKRSGEQSPYHSPTFRAKKEKEGRDNFLLCDRKKKRSRSKLEEGKRKESKKKEKRGKASRFSSVGEKKGGGGVLDLLALEGREQRRISEAEKGEREGFAIFLGGGNL